MNKAIAFATLLVASSSSLMAQGNVAAPPWMESNEGAQYAYYFGRYPGGITQLVTGHVSIGDTLKEVSMRAEGTRTYSTYYGGGRTWANVKLNIGRGEISSMDRTFSTNFSTTPTLVFSGSVTWDALSGAQSSPTWGGNGHKFPFGTGGTASSYTHLSTTDEVINEFEFTGGTLANSLTWSSSSSRYYYLDSAGNPWDASYASGGYMPSSLPANDPGCYDSYHTITSRKAYVYSTLSVYGGQYVVTNLRNKMRFYSYSYYTAPSALVMHVHAFANNSTGWNIFNTGCFKMHVSGPLLIEPKMSMPSAYSTSGYSGYTYWDVDSSSVPAGTEITTQAIWSDSVSGATKLTRAYTRTMPSPPPSNIAVRRLIQDYNKDGVAVYDYNGQYYANPAVLYKK